MRSIFKRFGGGLSKMKRKSNKRKNRNNSERTFSYIVAFIGLMILVIAFAGCAEPKIERVNVPVPCEVEKIPNEPRDIDLENATISNIMQYIKEIAQYAKEARPIMRSGCIIEKRVNKGK